MQKTLILFVALTLPGLFPPAANAGNPEVVHPLDGHPIGWENGAAIPYWMDTGPLGTLSNEEAQALVTAMMGVWESAETASVGFAYQGDLPEDVTEENFADYLQKTSCGGSRSDIPEGVVPIIFDTDGKILENFTGMGAADEIGGIAMLRCFWGSADDPKAIYQGMVIINGLFIDGKGWQDGSPDDLPVNGIAGIILHELGHLIGVDHSALNEDIYNDIAGGNRDAGDSRYLPVMLPVVLKESLSATTLKPDDISAISALYPADGHLAATGTIKGEIKKKDGGEVQKANVIARREDDPLCEAVSALSGRRCAPLTNELGYVNFNSEKCAADDKLGDYVIEGLLPGSYTVEVEELESGWISEGMYPMSKDGTIPGDAEFYNSGDAAAESPYLYSPVEAVAGSTASSVNIILSSSQSSPGQLDRIPLSTFDGGSGSRCLADSVDYGALLNTGGIASLTAAHSGDRGISGDAGCSVSAGRNEVGNYWLTAIAFGILLALTRLGKHLVVIASEAKQSPENQRGLLRRQTLLAMTTNCNIFMGHDTRRGNKDGKLS